MCGLKAVQRNGSRLAVAFENAARLFRPLFVHGDDYCADHRGGQQQARDFQRQNVFLQQRAADLLHGQLGFGPVVGFLDI